MNVLSEPICENERVRAVYQGRRPDRVPLMLDLSHWYKKNRNYDSNVQTQAFFDAYVRDYYTEVARRLHARGKWLAVHVDGESRGVLRWLAECGVDCADAVTPAPMFAHTPAQMRAEAGNELVLSGGIPATVFGSTGSDAEFDEAVKRWLETRLTSSRLLMAAGDQVPPDAPFERIMRLRELVELFGQY
jgi:uroporphyrinogen-III decarboxylase